MSIEAMKQALKALEYDMRPETEYGINTAITTLRQAIEQAGRELIEKDAGIHISQQKQEPCVFSENPSGCYRIRCQLGGKCVDDDMSFRASPPPRQPVQFPAMLRKMWSGSEVQAWLDENVNGTKENT